MASEGVPDFLTIAEAARILRTGRTTAYLQAQLWRDTGGKEGLPNRKVGNLARVPTALFEQQYGIRVTTIPPARDRRQQQQAKDAPQVRDLDAARSEPKARRRQTRGEAQGGLPFAG